MDSELKHVGVKGMKWGVRKAEPTGARRRAAPPGYTIYGDGRIEIRKGTLLQRLIGKDSNPGLAGMTFASFTKNDNARYINFIGGKGPLNGGRNIKLTLEAKTTLKSPSTTEAASIFFTLLRDNPKLMTIYDTTPIAAIRPITPKNISKLIENPGSKEAQVAYRIANMSSMYDAMGPVRDRFFAEVQKRGYNILRDENDVANLSARNPIILLDSAKCVTIKATELIDDMMRKEAKIYTKEHIKKGKEWLKEFGFNVETPLE